MAIKYKWLAGHLREQLPDYTANGIHRLPTEAAISQRYKVSRQTVRQALSVLEQEGLIEKRQGSGSYITGRSRGEDRIDLLLSSDSAYLYPMLLHDIKKTLAAQGFSTTVHITENTFSTEHTLLQKILHQPPRALLVEGVKTARTNPNLDLYRKLQKKKCPVLFLQESYPELTNCPCVTMDDFGGGILLTRHLLPTGITQNVKDLLSSREVENIFENSDFVYMLNQAGGDRQILARQLGISPHQLSYVTHSGEGEGLLFYGSTILPFVDHFPKNTELYRIMTTKPQEMKEADGR